MKYNSVLHLHRLLFVLLLSGFQSVQSQIICTDVNPDLVSTGNSTVDIDLNNDLTPDFRLTGALSGPLSFVVVQGSQIGMNNFVLSNGSGNAQALPLNTPIGLTSTTWTQMNSTNQIMITVMSGLGSGPWSGAIDQFLGLRLVVGLNTYYGWARFTFSNNSNTYTFKDYAYNSVPNQTIAAGQGCASITSPDFTLNSPICEGDSVVLTANTGTTIPTTINWGSTPGSIFSNSAAVTTTLSFPTVGVYTVMLMVTSGTLIGMVQRTVEVGFTYTLTSNSPVCEGQTVSIAASGGTSYAWAGPLGFNSTSASPTMPPANLFQSGTYSCLITSAEGCTVESIVSLSVNPLPTLTVTPATASICLNSGTTLTAIGTSVFYNWSPPQGLSSNSSPVVTASPTVSTNYTLTGIFNGCFTATVVPVYVVTPASAGVFSLSISSPTLCTFPHNGSPNTATLNLSGGNSYSLVGQNSPLINAVSNGSLNLVLSLVQPVPTSSTVANMTLNISNGVCTVLSPISVSILPNINITASPPISVICSGKTTQLFAGGAPTYSWNNSVSGLNMYSGDTVIAAPLASSVYSVYGVATSGCHSASKTLSVTVLPNPTVTALGQTLCVNGTGNLLGIGADSYLWTGPNSFLSFSPSIQVPTSPSVATHVYTLTGTAVNSCSSSIMVNVSWLSCSALTETNKNNGISVYPNPFSDQLFINSSSNTVAEIFDVTGKKVLVVVISGSETENLSMEKFVPGIYLVKISSTGSPEKLFKIVKE